MTEEKTWIRVSSRRTLDDITPEAMTQLERRMEYQAVENIIANDKNQTVPYICDTCGRTINTVPLNVGITDFRIPCEPLNLLPECRGIAICEGPRENSHLATFKGEVEFEWFRPISQEECRSFVKVLIKSTIAMLYSQGVRQGRDENMSGMARELEARRIYSEATRKLMTGSLVLRKRA